MSRKYWIVVGALIAAIAVIGAVAWSLRDDYAAARIATASAAMQTCSCVRVGGRPIDACLAEFEDEARITQDGAKIHASVLFGAISADAAYEEGYGCALID